MHRDTFTTLEGSNTGEAHWTTGFTIIVVFVVYICVMILTKELIPRA